MTNLDDEDLSELERRMRAKLFAVSSRRIGHSVLSEDDQRIARRLIGADNAARIANAKEGRRVRLAPVITTVEYYWVRTGDLRPDEWRIDVKVNHRREEQFQGIDPDELEGRLAEYRRRNIAPKLILLEGQQNRGAKAR
ncbi:hypothetical protein [Aureimonas frigidaquae]|uniref:Uncharacterized protein n=1 Tax=Aureimonas frigidaquae TaxID=424757 RepID=A0A0P0Z3Z7_9HYPH|nr:hypothetical protein [Aureimonas frigidaquae]BAT28723.1 hypothetical protein [Aureimonas frigidaquae]